MNDLERIEEIEKIIGFKLKRVEPEKFDFGSDKCVRRYSVDEYGNVTMLSFFKVPIHLIHRNFFSGFKKLLFLNLRSCRNIDLLCFKRKRNSPVHFLNSFQR